MLLLINTDFFERRGNMFFYTTNSLYLSGTGRVVYLRVVRLPAINKHTIDDRKTIYIRRVSPPPRLPLQQSIMDNFIEQFII